MMVMLLMLLSVATAAAASQVQWVDQRPNTESQVVWRWVEMWTGFEVMVMMCDSDLDVEVSVDGVVFVVVVKQFAAVCREKHPVNLIDCIQLMMQYCSDRRIGSYV